MNPDTLVAVSGYSGDVGQIENNLPLYKHHGCPVLILSPTDAPILSVSDKTVHCQWFGKAGWAGKHTLERHVLYLRALLTFPHSFFLFHDADSICLSPRISPYLYSEPGTFWSNIVQDLNPGLSLLPKVALQPPYFCHRRLIELQLDVLGNLPMSYYGDFGPSEGGRLPVPTDAIDHFVLQLAHGSGQPYKSFLDGASFETASLHGLATMCEQVQVHGRIFIHSVKTLSVLDRLRVEHKRHCEMHR